MNTTVLALQEEQVLVAVGKSGAQPSVQALYSAPAHGGGMENWEKAIGALWQQHRLPTRGITLVLPDEAVATKTITAPSMPVNKLEELVRHEMRPREDQLAAADYVPLGTDAEGRQQLFCAACRKETMEEYLARPTGSPAPAERYRYYGRTAQAPACHAVHAGQDLYLAVL